MKWNNLFKLKIPFNPLGDLSQHSPWKQSLSSLQKNRIAMLSLGFFSSIVLISLLAPVISPYDPNTVDILLGPKPPSFQHWFGTDILGRDLLSRTLYGGRLSISVGFAATLVSLVIGVSWGAVAGYSGGWIDTLMMRVVDILYSLPFMVFVILLMMLFKRSLLLLFVAIGFVEWLTLSRIVRAQVMQIKVQPYIEAAKCLGIRNFSLITRHILPNLMGPVIIYTTLTIPAVILLESSLSFLGLGVQPPNSSWGSLIKDGAETIATYPWILIFPSFFFTTTLLSLNFIGDSLRDTFDPKSVR